MSERNAFSATELIDAVRGPVLDELGAALSGRPLGPDLVVVARGLRSCDPPAERHALALVVDRVLTLTLNWLDERDGGDRASAYLEAATKRMRDLPDPYIAMFAEDLRTIIEMSPPQRLREASAAILEVLPQKGVIPDVVNMLRTNDLGGRRRLVARLRAEQTEVLGQPSRERDVLEAAILASNEDALFALTRASFRVLASGYVSLDDLEDLLRRSLS